jgi:hypothetical protein
MITSTLLTLIMLPPSEVAYVSKLRQYQDGDQWEYSSAAAKDGRQTEKPSSLTVKIAEVSPGKFESTQLMRVPMTTMFSQDSKTGNVTITGYGWNNLKPKSASMDGKVKSFACYMSKGVFPAYTTKDVRYAGKELLDLGFAKVECAKYKYTEPDESPFKGDVTTIWFNPTIGVNVKEMWERASGIIYTDTLTSTNVLR